MSKNQTKRKVSADTYEQEAWKAGNFVIGIDEAGRGCLAGPVVASAVAIITPTSAPFLCDSKLLTPAQRAIAYQWLQKNAYYSVGIVPAAQIDRTNILRATKQAMMLALKNLLYQIKSRPARILIDAVTLPHSFGILQEAHIRGELASISIAAASIIAKERRDTIMVRQSRYFPGFSFAQHKGYGTTAHYQELAKTGGTLIHRYSFAPLLKKDDHEQQNILFW